MQLLDQKTLINRLFSLEICVSYQRVLEVTRDMSQSLHQLETHEVFLPKS